MNKYEILINKTNEFKNESDYNLIPVTSRYCGNILVEEMAYKHFIELQKFVNNKGFDIDFESTYRSFDEQLSLFNEIKELKGLEHTLKFVAKPGYSEHQSGLAIDFLQVKDQNFIVEYDMDDELLKLVANNAHLFGFIIRYPQTKTHITGYGYEPWHLRFVGKKLAKHLNKNKLTLEEYYSN